MPRNVAAEVGAAVLCGGRGERLRPLTDYFQKTMVPIGQRKRPLLEYIVRLLAFHGVRNVTLLTGYRTKEISDYFRDGAAYGVKIRYSRDTKKGSGTLGAVSNALQNGAIPSCDVLVIYYGDILSNLNVTELARTHEGKNADATLVLSKGYTLPVGVAQVTGSRVRTMEEKPRIDISVTMGCMALGKRAMRLASKPGTKLGTDLMTDFVPELLRRKWSVVPYYMKGLWYDIGTVNGYEKVNAELKEKQLPFL